LLAIAVAAGPSAAQVPPTTTTVTTTSTTTTLPSLCPAAQDPCILGDSVTIPAGLYDIRPRSLDIKNKAITVSGSGMFEIEATNILFEPGARLIDNEPNGNISFTLVADGTFTTQSQGTSKSRIDVSGDLGGGTIDITAGGDVSIDGALLANASNTLGYAGSISLTSTAGNVSITGDPSVGLQANGNAQGGGGSIVVDAIVGAISVDSPLAAKNGDCSGCEIDLYAGTDVTTTVLGDIDLTSSGGGDGGTFYVDALNSITLNGNVVADGSGGVQYGGAGGEVDLYADGGALTVNGRTELNGASPDGDGGTTDFNAHTVLMQNGPIFAISTEFGQSFGLNLASDGDLVQAGEIDLTSDEFGGDLFISAGGLVTVSAKLHSTATIDPVNEPDAQAGACEIDACQINMTATGQLICTGPGPAPSGANVLNASTGLTIAGTLTATNGNELTWRTTPPAILGTASVTPAPKVTQDPTLPCCGVSCPTTTTTTTSTTLGGGTTSTTVSTTLIGSTTSIIPTTTSVHTTTNVPTTTSSSTSTVGPTSTSTTGSTSSSTSSSTTSTPASTTSSSTAVAATTTTSNARTTTSNAHATTSTTAPAETCLDTASGIDAVRCRLSFMSQDIATASEADLGGKKLAQKLASRIAKAQTLVGDPVKPRRLKKAGHQLKAFSKQLGSAVGGGKVKAEFGTPLEVLATDAQNELAGLVSTGP
jgi:hypothetical protein